MSIKKTIDALFRMLHYIENQNKYGDEVEFLVHKKKRCNTSQQINNRVKAPNTHKKYKYTHRTKSKQL